MGSTSSEDVDFRKQQQQQINLYSKLDNLLVDSSFDQESLRHDYLKGNSLVVKDTQILTNLYLFSAEISSILIKDMSRLQKIEFDYLSSESLLRITNLASVGSISLRNSQLGSCYIDKLPCLRQCNFTHLEVDVIEIRECDKLEVMNFTLVSSNKAIFANLPSFQSLNAISSNAMVSSQAPFIRFGMLQTDNPAIGYWVKNYSPHYKVLLTDIFNFGIQTFIAEEQISMGNFSVQVKKIRQSSLLKQQQTLNSIATSGETDSDSEVKIVG